MEWFSGDVGTAVRQCKQTNTVLLVFIAGVDEVSKAMENVLNHAEVASIVREGRCVALKLTVDSIEGQQFSQIYPVLTVPSTYLIGSDGKPMEVVAGSCTLEDFTGRIKKTLSISRVSGPSTPLNQIPGEAISNEVVGTSQSTSEVVEAKVKSAKEKIKMKLEKKAQEEKERTKQKEIERRKLGADMEQLKQFKAEQEAKETREEMKREKEETKRAREKVRQQIAMDREARQANFQKEKIEKEEEIQRKKNVKLAKEAEEAARMIAQNSAVARIQFRLPDGANVNTQFEADEPLLTARSFIALHSSNPLGDNFRLATIYPRKVFTVNDYELSFRAHDLVPTSALLVLPPARGKSDTVQSQGASSILNTIFAPFMMIWTFISGFLFPPANVGTQQQPPPTQNTNTTSQETQGARPKTGKRVGRLSDLPKDDDMNTWNGNSTQQE